MLSILSAFTITHPIASLLDLCSVPVPLSLTNWSSLVAQLVRDLVLSLLWHGFDPWPQNFCTPQAQPKGKKKKERKKKRLTNYYTDCWLWLRFPSKPHSLLSHPVSDRNSMEQRETNAFPTVWIFILLLFIRTWVNHVTFVSLSLFICQRKS